MPPVGMLPAVFERQPIFPQVVEDTVRLTWTISQSHQHRIRGLANCLNNDICALADAKSDQIGHIRLHRDKIVRHDSHIVTIDAEKHDAFSSVVDKSEKVLLASLEVEFGDSGMRVACYIRLRAGVVCFAVYELLNG